MAANLFNVFSGQISLTASTAKTAIQIEAPTNIRVKVLGIGLWGFGTSNTDPPVQIRLLRQTSAGTPGSTPTPSKKDYSRPETIQTTAGVNYSGTEPTNDYVYDVLALHPQTQQYMPYPFGEGYEVAGGDRFGVELTAGVTETVAVTLYCEE